jgi:UDP-N-acetylmuramyl pentapeptide synthase
LDINIVKLINNLREINMPAGRLNIILGIKKTYLIDDTYNASPESTLAALDFINKLKFKACRRIVVLGEMLELGSFTDKGHELVGKSIYSSNIDFLFAVGEKARGIIRGAIESGFPKDKTFYFNDTNTAGRFLQEFLEINDIVLIKGSQGVRMEKIVKEVMAEPLKAKNILVRQNKAWS